MVLLTSPLTTKETLGFMFLTHGQYNLLVNDPSGFCVPHQPTFLLSLRHHGMKARALLCPRQLLLQCTSARGTLCTAGEVPAPTSRHLRERAVGILPLGNPSIQETRQSLCISLPCYFSPRELLFLFSWTSLHCQEADPSKTTELLRFIAAQKALLAVLQSFTTYLSVETSNSATTVWMAFLNGKKEQDLGASNCARASSPCQYSTFLPCLLHPAAAARFIPYQKLLRGKAPLLIRRAFRPVCSQTGKVQSSYFTSRFV